MIGQIVVWRKFHGLHLFMSRDVPRNFTVQYEQQEGVAKIDVGIGYIAILSVKFKFF